MRPPFVTLQTSRPWSMSVHTFYNMSLVTVETAFLISLLDEPYFELFANKLGFEITPEKNSWLEENNTMKLNLFRITRLSISPTINTAVLTIVIKTVSASRCSGTNMIFLCFSHSNVKGEQLKPPHFIMKTSFRFTHASVVYFEKLYFKGFDQLWSTLIYIHISQIQ